jgi:hypothetical protein
LPLLLFCIAGLASRRAYVPAHARPGQCISAREFGCGEGRFRAGSVTVRGKSGLPGGPGKIQDPPRKPRLVWEMAGRSGHWGPGSVPWGLWCARLLMTRSDPYEERDGWVWGCGEKLTSRPVSNERSTRAIFLSQPMTNLAGGMGATAYPPASATGSSTQAPQRRVSGSDGVDPLHR